LVGSSKQELGASEIAYMLSESGEAEGIGGEVPQLANPESQLNTYRALSKTIQSGLVRTAHDCSEGGIAVAVAEMCIGGRCGANIDLDGTGSGDVWGRMWGESLGRIVVGVSAGNEADFVEAMAGHSITLLGISTVGDTLIVSDGYDELVELDVDSLVTAWQGTLDLTGGVA
jgi:phosphoribosylformylglycinamidine synthase